jgi:hypothetical protein
MPAPPLSIAQCLLVPVGTPVACPPEVKAGIVTFQCLKLLVRGSVELGTPPAGAAPVRETLFPRPHSYPIGLGWRVGWIQLCCQEEVWGLYRGKTPTDGTMLAKWPPGEALDMQSTDTRDLFVKMSGQFYKYLTPDSRSAVIEMQDFPIQQFHASLLNKATMKDNELAVAVVRLSFILALAVRDPDDHLHVLRSINWWVRCETTFKPGADGVLVATTVPSKTGAGLTNPHDGGPPKLMSAIAGAAHASANTLAQNSVETCYPRWQDLASLRPPPPAPTPPRPKPKT